jgi:hypothetical protein
MTTIVPLPALFRQMMRDKTFRIGRIRALPVMRNLGVVENDCPPNRPTRQTGYHIDRVGFAAGQLFDAFD